MTMPSSNPMEQLIAILTGQRECYAALLRLAEQKHQAIVADDLRTIEHTVEQEQVLIASLGRMERDRMALAEPIAALLQLPIAQLNVTSVLERVDAATRRVLVGLRDEIVRDLGRAEELNHTNGELLEKALRRVNRSMQILGVNAQQSNTYRPQTQQTNQQRTKTNLFDRKV